MLLRTLGPQLCIMVSGSPGPNAAEPGRSAAEVRAVYRYVVQTFEPTPGLDGDRWVAVVCPPGVSPEPAGPATYRTRVGPTVATARALGAGWGGWEGPAFELAFPDDAPPDLVQEQVDRLWDRFSRAVRRPPPWSDVRAHLLTIAVPGWVHPKLGGDEPE
jgi:hypothetical protein